MLVRRGSEPRRAGAGPCILAWSCVICPPGSRATSRRVALRAEQDATSAHAPSGTSQGLVVPLVWPSALRGVLLVGDVLEPGHDLAAVVGFLDGDVGHEPAGGGAVPVLLAGLDVDDVAGADLLRRRAVLPRRAT